MLVQAAPVLLGAMIGALIGMVAWGFRRSREGNTDSEPRGQDDVLVGFAAFAAMILASFLVYLFSILVGR